MSGTMKRLCLGAAAATAAAFLMPTPAWAQTVHCGDTLTGDTVLGADLTCASGDGLILSPDVTLDLGGHTLTAAGAGRGVVAASTGHNVVKNGRITGWATGVAAAPLDPNAGPPSSEGRIDVIGIRFDHDVVGVNTSAGEIGGPPATEFQIRYSSFRATTTGVLGFTADAFVSSSVFSDNHEGLLFDSSSVSSDHLVLKRNQVGFSCTESECSLGYGLLLDNPAAIQTNFIGSFTLDHSAVSGSETAFSGAGFAFTYNLSVNAFTDNTTAMRIDAGQGSVSKNVFTGNQTGFTSSDTSADIPLTLSGNLLVHNGDAISIDDATGVGLRENVAAYNNGWGIRAPNATDLGGNRAGHNTNSPQCIGVVCGPV
jgi:hypothetical protein